MQCADCRKSIETVTDLRRLFLMKLVHRCVCVCACYVEKFTLNDDVIMGSNVNSFSLLNKFNTVLKPNICDSVAPVTKATYLDIFSSLHWVKYIFILSHQ